MGRELLGEQCKGAAQFWRRQAWHPAPCRARGGGMGSLCRARAACCIVTQPDQLPRPLRRWRCRTPWTPRSSSKGGGACLWLRLLAAQHCTWIKRSNAALSISPDQSNLTKLPRLHPHSLRAPQERRGLHEAHRHSGRHSSPGGSSRGLQHSLPPGGRRRLPPPRRRRRRCRWRRRCSDGGAARSARPAR